MRYVINPENLLKYYPIYLDNRLYVFVLDSYADVDTRSINYFNNGVLSFYSSDDAETEKGFSKNTVENYKLDPDGKSKYCGFIPNLVSSNCIASDAYSFRELLAAVAQENEQLCGSDPVIQKEIDVLSYKVNPANREWSKQEKEKINVVVKELSANTLWMDRKYLKTISEDEIMPITDLLELHGELSSQKEKEYDIPHEDWMFEEIPSDGSGVKKCKLKCFFAKRKKKVVVPQTYLDMQVVSLPGFGMDQTGTYQMGNGYGDFQYRDYGSGLKDIEELVLPDTVESMDLSGLVSLKTVNIPSSMTILDNHCFMNCAALEEVDLTSQVSVIGEKAFYGCETLAEIRIPEGVTAIGAGAFGNCKSLREIHLPAGITKICKDTFAGCSLLEQITIPEGVTEIEWGAFQGCGGITELKLPESLKSIAIGGCANLKYLHLPMGIQEINCGECPKEFTLITDCLVDFIRDEISNGSIKVRYELADGTRVLTYDEEKRKKEQEEYQAQQDAEKKQREEALARAEQEEKEKRHNEVRLTFNQVQGLLEDKAKHHVLVPVNATAEEKMKYILKTYSAKDKILIKTAASSVFDAFSEEQKELFIQMFAEIEESDNANLSSVDEGEITPEVQKFLNSVRDAVRVVENLPIPTNAERPKVQYHEGDDPDELIEQVKSEWMASGNTMLFMQISTQSLSPILIDNNLAKLEFLKIFADVNMEDSLSEPTAEGQEEVLEEFSKDEDVPNEIMNGLAEEALEEIPDETADGLAEDVSEEMAVEAMDDLPDSSLEQDDNEEESIEEFFKDEDVPNEIMNLLADEAPDVLEEGDPEELAEDVSEEMAVETMDDLPDSSPEQDDNEEESIEEFSKDEDVPNEIMNELADEAPEEIPDETADGLAEDAAEEMAVETMDDLPDSSPEQDDNEEESIEEFFKDEDVPNEIMNGLAEEALEEIPDETADGLAEDAAEEMAVEAMDDLPDSSPEQDDNEEESIEEFSKDEDVPNEIMNELDDEALKEIPDETADGLAEDVSEEMAVETMDDLPELAVEQENIGEEALTDDALNSILREISELTLPEDNGSTEESLVEMENKDTWDEAEEFFKDEDVPNEIMNELAEETLEEISDLAIEPEEIDLEKQSVTPLAISIGEMGNSYLALHLSAALLHEIGITTKWETYPISITGNFLNIAIDGCMIRYHLLDREENRKEVNEQVISIINQSIVGNADYNRAFQETCPSYDLIIKAVITNDTVALNHILEEYGCPLYIVQDAGSWKVKDAHNENHSVQEVLWMLSQRIL